VRYRDRRWVRVRTAAGPDRVSGGQWEDGYAREYFRALGEDGTLVWLFRDGVDGGWYLHGWWD
jgi:protein ImuB